MKRIAALLIISAVLICTLSGCSFSVKTPEKLMSPPKLTGSYQLLQEEFERVVGTEVDFVTPANGERKSAFIVEDFNADSVEDAMVFYSPKEGEKTVNIAVFTKQDENWNYIKTVSGSGDSVDCVLIKDFNGDGTSEIAVGWNVLTLNKLFTVYEPNTPGGAEYFRTLGSYPYSMITTVDVNSDNKEEIFYVNIDTAANVPSASAGVVSVGKDGKLEEIGKTPIDGNVSGYSNIYIDSDYKDGTLIMVDAYKNEHDMITELLFWNNKTSKLTAPIFEVETQTTTATWRNSRTPVSDIDADGHYEIPVGIEIKGSTKVVGGELQEDKLYYTCWSEFNYTRLKAEKYMIYNPEQEYSFSVPSSWVGKITLTSQDSQLYFYRWNTSTSEHLGNQLLSIVSHSKQTSGIGGYSNLADYKDKSFEYQITEDGNRFGITGDLVKNGFLIETEG